MINILLFLSATDNIGTTESSQFHLPQKCLTTVLSFLPNNDVSALETVNRAFYNAGEAVLEERSIVHISGIKTFRPCNKVRSKILVKAMLKILLNDESAPIICCFPYDINSLVQIPIETQQKVQTLHFEAPYIQQAIFRHITGSSTCVFYSNVTLEEQVTMWVSCLTLQNIMASGSIPTVKTPSPQYVSLTPEEITTSRALVEKYFKHYSQNALVLDCGNHKGTLKSDVFPEYVEQISFATRLHQNLTLNERFGYGHKHISSITFAPLMSLNKCFCNCPNLRFITFNIRMAVENYSFSGCDKLRAIHLPLNLIDDSCFTDCNGLEFVRISGESPPKTWEWLLKLRAIPTYGPRGSEWEGDDEGQL